MIDLRGRWIATAFALATCALTFVALMPPAALAAPMIQGDGPMINGVETTLAESATSSNDTRSNTDLSQGGPRHAAVNEASSASW